MQIQEPHKRKYLSREEKIAFLKKAAGKKGYIVTNDLKPITVTHSEPKHACQVKADRYVKEGLLFPGNWRKPHQRYFLSAEERDQAVADRPLRKRPDYSKLSKCVVTQAPPSSERPDGQNPEITHENTQKEPCRTVLTTQI